MTFFSCKGDKETKYYQASYPVRFVFDGEEIATVLVEHGKLASLPSDVTLPEIQEGYGILWLGMEEAIKGEKDIKGYLYQGDETLARRALSTPSLTEGGTVGETVSSLLYFALYQTDGMRDVCEMRLSSLASLDSEDFTEYESSLLVIALSLLSDDDTISLDGELLALVENLSEKMLDSENTALRLISAIFLHTLLGDERFATLVDEPFVFEGFTLSTKEALLEKAFLMTYTETVTNGYSKNSVTYAYIADNTLTPYEGEVGMFSALCGANSSDAFRAGEDMALMSASLIASRLLRICDLVEQRPSVFAKMYVGNADLMYKLSHGYLSFDGEKQRYATEGNVHPAYIYLKNMYLSLYGDISQDNFPKVENVTGAEHLVSAGENKSSNLTITLSGKADAILREGQNYSDNDFLLEFSVLADDNTATAEYRIRLYGGDVTCIANIKGTSFTIKKDVLIPVDGAPSSFTLGEYGWHRFAMRFSQKTTLVDGEVSYRLLFTFYLDGEEVGTYEGNNALFLEKGYLLQNADVENGELTFGNANQVYFQMYRYNFYNKENSAYFFYLKDVLTSVGQDFIRQVKPLSFTCSDGAFPQDGILNVTESTMAPSSYAVCNVLHYYLLDEYAILPEPTLAGYRFAGWYADADLTIPVDAISPLKDTPKMLYAKWEEYRPEGSVTLVYDLPWSDVVLPPEVPAGLLREQIGQTVSLPILDAPVGQRFLGWRIDNKGDTIFSFVFTEEMSESGKDIYLYAAFAPVAIDSAKSTTPSENPNMFYAILQSQDATTLNLAERPYISYEFDYTAGMAIYTMNFALHNGAGNELMFFDLSKEGKITLNTMVYPSKETVATLSEGEYRVAIILEQGHTIQENEDGTYTVKYYFDMTIYIDGEVIGTYRTKEDAVFFGENQSYLFYEVVATEQGYEKATVKHTNTHLRVRMRTTRSAAMVGVSSFINDAYLFNTKTPVYLNVVEEEVEE